MRLLTAALLTAFVAASAWGQTAREPLESELKRAQAEQAAAEAETAKLQQKAANARSEAERLRAEQAAAAQAIDAAEARITAADTQYRLASAYVMAHRQRLALEQRPVSSLLAGLATMARRPPLLALVDEGGTDELVKVSVLLGATLPVIRERTRGISGALSQGQQLQHAALAARAELIRSRQQLAVRREQFASLERRALDQSLAAGGQALNAGDFAISAGEQVEQLRAEQSTSLSARQVASLLAAEQPAPPRPVPPAGRAEPPPFLYVLPADAAVLVGLGAVDESGVRSRGVTLATPRGAAVVAPAAGSVRYSGPFREYDGVLIIDHGGGWMSVIVNVGSQLRPGDRVRAGEAVGSALGPLDVQLSRNGQRYSPPIIAGSSRSLSKTGKGG